MANERDRRDSPDRPTLRVVSGGASRASGAPASAAAMTDEALLAAFLVGDDGAFDGLVRRHERLVLSLVRRYARTPEDARDLTQRTFLRAFEAARRTLRTDPRTPFTFRRWIIRVALNLAKNHLRDELRVPRTSLEALGPAEARPADQGDALEHAQLARRMRSAVVELPRRQREVLTLRIDGELPFAEIGAALGITENAAKVTFHHATRKLREVLSEEDPS
jgi:RNA polymerase sigma-70 factor (ECF subfamily)